MIVASSMVVFFCLILTLSVQLVIMANQNSMKRSLEAQRQELQTQLAEGQQKMDYYSTKLFVDEYALTKLYSGRDGAKIFQND